jgi:hypothetical protein
VTWRHDKGVTKPLYGHIQGDEKRRRRVRMGTPDDFSLWEEEVEGGTESANTTGMIVTSLVMMAGAGALIALGVTMLGIAALAVLALILILWRAGM